jgi:hypothetical protein
LLLVKLLVGVSTGSTTFAFWPVEVPEHVEGPILKQKYRKNSAFCDTFFIWFEKSVLLESKTNGNMNWRYRLSYF